MKRSRLARYKNKKGASLMELLVAMTCESMILLVCLSQFSYCIKAINETVTIINDGNENQMVMQVVQEAVQQSAYIQIVASGTITSPDCKREAIIGVPEAKVRSAGSFNNNEVGYVNYAIVWDNTNKTLNFIIPNKNNTAIQESFVIYETDSKVEFVYMERSNGMLIIKICTKSSSGYPVTEKMFCFRYY